MRKYPFDRELAYGDFWPVYDWTWNGISLDLEDELRVQLVPTLLIRTGERLLGDPNFSRYLRDDVSGWTWPR
ncbi:hypothetical protein [Nocardia nova]|uniref:hypothetical protein n=1 Tax=Nocardia nova TaxID=37330 RepID=UPI002739D0ED|nr:hypothetical protein [Nocardia nova]